MIGLLRARLNNPMILSHCLMSSNRFLYRRYFSTNDSTLAKMFKVLCMPSLSPTMETGSIKNLNVKIGDKIESGDLIAEVETDKSTMDWESSEQGFVAKILADISLDLNIGDPVLILAKKAEMIDKVSQFEAEGSSNKVAAKAEESVVDEKQTENPIETQIDAQFIAKEQNIEKIKDNELSDKSDIGKRSVNKIKNDIATPAAKMMMKEKNINPANITGSGNFGCIRLSDIDSACNIEYNANKSESKDIPLTTARKYLAKSITRSYQTIPHFYLTISPAISALESARCELNSMNSKLQNSTGHAYKKITINDILIRAIGLSTAKHPQINSSWAGDKIVRSDEVHVCFAVASPTGLITPTVHNADKLPLALLASRTAELIEKANQGKLKPDEYSGGTICLSNLGMLGVEQFTGIIVEPMSAILTVGAAKDELRLVDGQVVTRKFLPITIGCDHRVFDGHDGALYLQTLKSYLETPSLLALA
ncbi:MAG: pyruvate dehydrogenase complex dihydrolipoamide acetyltransferase component (E2) [Marteilia pararefringens]